MKPSNTQLRQIEELCSRLLTRQGADKLVRALLHLDGESGWNKIQGYHMRADDALVEALHPHIEPNLLARVGAEVEEDEEQSIGGMLRRYRRHHGVTQAQLAERLGVTQATVHKWESGNHVPPPRQTERIAAGLGFRLDVMRAAREVSIELRDAS